MPIFSQLIKTHQRQLTKNSLHATAASVSILLLSFSLGSLRLNQFTGMKMSHNNKTELILQV